NRAEMYGAGLSPDLHDSTCFAQADGQKNLGQDPALQVMRVRDGAKTRKAAASRLRRNSKARSELISPTESVERAELKSNALSEIQLLLPAMFQVLVSWLFPFEGSVSVIHPQDDFSVSVTGLTKLVGTPRFAERNNAIDQRREFARIDDLCDLGELRAVRLRAQERSPDAEFFGFLLRGRLD